MGMDNAAGPEKISADILTKLGSLNESDRENHLTHPNGFSSGYSQAPSQSPYSYHPGYSLDFSSNRDYGSDGYAASDSNAVQRELASQLADMRGSSLRHRGAAVEDLAEVVTKVNEVGLAPDLKLEQINSASNLTISNAHAERGHQKINIDLSSGTISDESGQHYVATQNKGLVDFVPKKPVEVKLDKLGMGEFDSNDQLTRLTLPDQTVLTRQDGQQSSFAITGPKGDARGTALAPVVNGDELSYISAENGQFVLLRNNKMLSMDKLGKIYAKDQSADGDPLPILNQSMYLQAYQYLAVVGNQRGIHVPPPVPYSDLKKETPI
jgi:hypothetical protein